MDKLILVFPTEKVSHWVQVRSKYEVGRANGIHLDGIGEVGQG